MNIRKTLLFTIAVACFLNGFAQKDTTGLMERIKKANEKRRATDMVGNTLSRSASTPLTLDPGVIYIGTTPYNGHETIISGNVPSRIRNAHWAEDYCAGVTINDGVSPYHYQWDMSTNYGATWVGVNSSDLSGVFGSSYQPPALTQTTYYRRVAWSYDAVGCTIRYAYSNPVYIYVQNPGNLNGGSIGVSSPSVCLNGLATITNANSSSGGILPLTYSWEQKTATGNFTTIPNANSLSYNTQALTEATIYRRKTIDAAGVSAYSNEITVSILSTSAIAAINNGSSISGNCSVILNAQTATNNTYQWQVKDASNLFQNINAATSSSYTATQSGDYRVIVTNTTCGGGSVNSQPTIVTLTQAIPGIPLDFGTNQWKLFAYNGTDIQLNANAYRGYYDYALSVFNNLYEPSEYTRSQSPSFLPVNPNWSSPWYGCSVNADNFTIAAQRRGFACGSYKIRIRVGANELYEDYLDGSLIGNGGNPTSSTSYTLLSSTTLDANSTLEIRVRHYNANFRFDLEVEQQAPTLTAGNINVPSSQTINFNTLPAAFTSAVDATSTNGQVTYQWEKAISNSGPWSIIPNAINAGYSSPALLQTTYFRRGATNGTACEGPKYSGTINVAVTNIPLPLQGGTITPSTTSICDNSTTLLINNSVAAYQGLAPYSYTWEQQDQNGAFVAIPNATNSSIDMGFITQTIIIRRKVTDAAGVQAFSNEVTVQKFLPGTISTATQTIVSGNAITISSISPASGTNGIIGYQWESSKNVNGPWTPVPNAINTSLQTGALTQNKYFRRMAVSSTCLSTIFSNIAEVLVEAIVAVPLNGGSITPPASPCVTTGTAPSSLNATLASGGTSPYKYVWQKNENGAWTNIPASNTQHYQPTALTMNTIFRRQVTDNAGIIAYTNEVIFNLQSSTLKAGIVDAP